MENIIINQKPEYLQAITNCPEKQDEIDSALEKYQDAINTLKTRYNIPENIQTAVVETLQKQFSEYLNSINTKYQHSIKIEKAILDKKMKQLESEYDTLYDYCVSIRDQESRKDLRIFMDMHGAKNCAILKEKLTEKQKVHKQIDICQEAFAIFEKIKTRLRMKKEFTQSIELKKQHLVNQATNLLQEKANKAIAEKVALNLNIAANDLPTNQKTNSPVAKSEKTWHDKIFNELHNHQLGMMHHANI